MANRPIYVARCVSAAHLILTGYGHWAPNDPRGSESTDIATPKLRELGPIHYGRKKIQPSRDDLRSFHRQFAGRLIHEVVWFDNWLRIEIARGVANAIRERGYTCYACAVLRNHVHLVIRTHVMMRRR